MLWKSGKRTDENLLAAIRAGGNQEEEACKYVLEDFYRIVVKQLDKNPVPGLIADDLFQEVFLEWLRKVRNEEFEIHQTLHAYFFVIVRNRLVDRIRAKKRKEGKLVPLRDDHQPLAYETWMDAEEENRMLAILQLFPSDKCVALFKLVAKGWQYLDIAEHYGYGRTPDLGVNTVKTAMRRCRNKLGLWLAKQPEMKKYVDARHPFYRRKFLRE